MNKQPKCPRCGRKGKPIGDGVYRCAFGHLFDDEPDEGGTHSDDPTRRLQLEDEQREARRINTERRGQAAQGFRFRRRASNAD